MPNVHIQYDASLHGFIWVPGTVGMANYVLWFFKINTSESKFFCFFLQALIMEKASHNPDHAEGVMKSQTAA